MRYYKAVNKRIEDSWAIWAVDEKRKLSRCVTSSNDEFTQKVSHWRSMKENGFHPIVHSVDAYIEEIDRDDAFVETI